MTQVMEAMATHSVSPSKTKDKKSKLFPFQNISTESVNQYCLYVSSIKKLSINCKY